VTLIGVTTPFTIINSDWFSAKGEYSAGRLVGIPRFCVENDATCSDRWIYDPTTNSPCVYAFNELRS
jgi:hypothetical protein